jgi:hypothetical protein
MREDGGEARKRVIDWKGSNGRTGAMEVLTAVRDTENRKWIRERGSGITPMRPHYPRCVFHTLTTLSFSMNWVWKIQTP